MLTIHFQPFGYEQQIQLVSHATKSRPESVHPLMDYEPVDNATCRLNLIRPKLSAGEGV